MGPTCTSQGYQADPQVSNHILPFQKLDEENHNFLSGLQINYQLLLTNAIKKGQIINKKSNSTSRYVATELWNGYGCQDWNIGF